MVLPTGLYENRAGGKRMAILTSQFWARRDTSSVFHANDVQPSASRPMDISCRKFIANTVRNGSSAPLPMPESEDQPEIPQRSGNSLVMKLTFHLFHELRPISF